MFKTLISLAALELPDAPDGAEVPDWIHVLPRGDFAASDGRGPWRYTDAEDLIRESFARHPRLHIDLNHSTGTAAKAGLDAPAVGYVTKMEEREDGIWALVDWTRRGRELLSDRAYWGVSPVIATTKDGRVTHIANAALTNDPAVTNLTPLSRKDLSMFMKKLAEMLGLTEDASEDEILAALEKMKGKGADTGSEALSAELAKIGAALGIEGEVTTETLVTTAKVMTAAGGDQTEALAVLQAEVKELRDGGKKTRAETFVDKAIGDKRVGVNAATRDDYIALHVENPERTEKMIGALPTLGSSGTHLTPPAAKDGEIALSADQKAAAKALGIPPETYLETLKAEHAAMETL